MESSIILIAADGTAGRPGVPVEGTFPKTFGNQNAMPTVITIPVISQLQEKMSINARAQRRALMEPIPSHTNTTAKMP
jgi:hypothetical protein